MKGEVLRVLLVVERILVWIFVRFLSFRVSKLCFVANCAILHRCYDRVCSAVLFTPVLECRRDLSSIRLELELVVVFAVLARDNPVVIPTHTVLQQVRRLFRPNGGAAGNGYSEELSKV